MYHIFKSPAAENDLQNIWLYSFNQWDERQADRYYDELISGIERLADYPTLGKSREHVRSGYYSIHINRHVVYYQIEDETIHIIRVLHERMIPNKHL